MQTNNTGLQVNMHILDYEKFRLICCNTLFPSKEVEQNGWRIRNIFDLFDNDRDGFLKGLERDVFAKWLITVLKPVNALLIVDMQNDFIDGTLALRACQSRQDGFDVVEPINRLVKCGLFDKVIYSMDWHPENHISFYENLHLRELHPKSLRKEDAKVLDSVIFSKPYLEQILWPKHCVAHTWGAQLHKDLVIASGSEQVLKGTHPEEEAYSVFAAKDSEGVHKLEEILRESGVTQLFVCGLAYDVCVKFTCLDGLRLGHSVVVIDNCCRCVNLEHTETAKQLIAKCDGLIVDSEKVIPLITGEEKSLILSHQSARKIASISFPGSSTNSTE